jgi:altronate hydrolase
MENGIKSMSQYILIDGKDNVAVASADLCKGTALDIHDRTVELKSDIPRGHKFAVAGIRRGENVIKYGYPIGHAVENIETGGLVDERNLKTNLESMLEYEYVKKTVEVEHRQRNLTFKGYRRKNGDAAVRNELWVVPTVGCVNGTGDRLLGALRAEAGDLKIDGTLNFKHVHGCSQLGDDYENTRKILRDIVLHPNAGGVLVLGLGCEGNQPGVFEKFLGDYDRDRVKFLVTQNVRDEHEEGMKLLRELYAKASEDRREDILLSELRVGLECGGSDGMSGITANPLLGTVTDLLVGQGASCVLTEVPEMFGAETILMERARDRATFDKIVRLINGFKNFYLENNQPVYENPSAGNKAGGISTLEEKSLGCVQKCGTAAVSDVLMYGDRIRRKGLSLLGAPGNDLVSVTALGAAGCHMILFTTGRGTPCGSFVPTIKISSNTALAENKPHWIDLDAGPIAGSGKSPNELAEELLSFILEAAGGKKTKNEISGHREIAIFKSGVTL